jgi:hypothetical protein
MKSFSNVLRFLSQLIDNDYSCYLIKVRAELYVIFAKYDEKFGSVRLQRATQSGLTLRVRKELLGVRFLRVMLILLVLVLLVLLFLVLVLVVVPPCVGDHLLVLCCGLLFLVLV